MKYKHDKDSFLDYITVDGILDTILFINILLFIIVYVLQFKFYIYYGRKKVNIMLFNANKKNKEDLKIINERIARLEEIKASNKYDAWPINNEILLENEKIAKEKYELTIQTNRETYLKNIIFISKVVCVSAIGGVLAHIVTKDNKS